MNFDTDGYWDTSDLEGPAIHAPADIKAIVVNKYRIEWLNISDPTKDFYAKNHMVATVLFAQSQCINNEWYLSARLSMELGPEKVVPDANETLVSGSEYNPGVYTLAMLSRDTPTFSAAHYLTYPLRQGTTIGTLIDKIIDKKMHHFLFLPYTSESRWKGCGDHILHCWAVFFRDGDITSEWSEENFGKTLSEELTQTYILGGASTYARIGRGWWLSHQPLEDIYAPESVFSTADPNFQRRK
ncbi:uncharacterized protein LAESUDRAFT_751269 [Laetiporus sulphureus 93-53]|uniref:Uncharacterized protein n=1 Tax=Laetiporus sulphureus 93-53 TaxID=1314785 RepID=A0A165D5Q5_9APHY|nr:uncharacterized protein LAESUDRAFT_751269 [Laetiporus sulphureus 93-53]KZT04198.1 hypothetical protein LAESUDRAFT_751269 [Laetiporus sulphureus 93-53]